MLTALPEVNDFSLHFYYDDQGQEARKPKHIPWRLRQFHNAWEIAQSLRPHHEVKVWITEHARGVDLSRPKPMQRAALTSNFTAAISVADFMSAIANRPWVQGAALHGLNAGPWQALAATIGAKDLSPRPTLDALALLRQSVGQQVIASQVRGPHLSGYGGGYDVSAVALIDSITGSRGVWLTNRADTELLVSHD